MVTESVLSGLPRKGKIAWYKTPKYIKFVDEFPLNAAGKIKKFVLREMAHELWPDA